LKISKEDEDDESGAILLSTPIQSPRVLLNLWSSGEIAPFQILRMFTQSSLHRIAKDITKLFYEPLIIPNDKVGVAFLPKMIRLASQVPRYPCFSDLMASAMALGDRYPARSGIDDFTRLSF
jgi:hypothetical protein